MCLVSLIRLSVCTGCPVASSQVSFLSGSVLLVTSLALSFCLSIRARRILDLVNVMDRLHGVTLCYISPEVFPRESNKLHAQQQ